MWWPVPLSRLVLNFYLEQSFKNSWSTDRQRCAKKFKAALCSFQGQNGVNPSLARDLFIFYLL
jgi:hypothetical protein